VNFSVLFPAALGTDIGHVAAVLADRLAAFAAGVARLLGIELVRRPLLVAGLAALRGDLLLLRFGLLVAMIVPLDRSCGAMSAISESIL
jgi:hypothetical protein